MRKRLIGLLVGGVLLWPASAAAQVAWDSPFLLPPRPPGGFGIYLMEAAGGDLGVMVTFRGERPRGGGIGLRAGVAEDRPDELAVFGGVDLSGLLATARPDFPLDVALVGGAGLSVGEGGALLSFPFGVSLGGTVRAEQLVVTPYFTPRIVVDAFFRDEDPDTPGRDDDDLDLDLAVDIGVDLAFRRGWAIRFGATIGRDALAIGIVF